MIATASSQVKGQFSGSYLPLINILNFICKRSAAMQLLVTSTVASCCLHSYCNSFLDNFVFYCCWLQPDQRQPRRCFGLDSLHGPAHDSRSKVGGHADPRVCRHCIENSLQNCWYIQLLWSKWHTYISSMDYKQVGNKVRHTAYMYVLWNW